MMRNTSAECDGAEAHVTVVDVPAFVRGFQIASAGKFGHGLLKRSIGGQAILPHETKRNDPSAEVTR